MTAPTFKHSACKYIRVPLLALAIAGSAVASVCVVQTQIALAAPHYQRHPHYKELVELAEEGNVDAMGELGYWLLDQGETKEAIRWFKAAANNGHVGAMFTLGQAYEFGLGGLEKNETSAFRWYQQAAIAGDYDAALLIAKMYIEGRGIAKSLVAASTILKKNTQALHAPSILELAKLYDSGQGVPKSASQAVKLYERAALEGGLAEAMALMASKYANGDLNFDKNLFEAYKWGFLTLFFTPSEDIEKQARQVIDQVSKTLEASQQIAARKAADKWMEKYHAYQIKKQDKQETKPLHAFQ